MSVLSLAGDRADLAAPVEGREDSGAAADGVWGAPAVADAGWGSEASGPSKPAWSRRPVLTPCLTPFPQADVVCMVYDVSEEATIEKVRV